MFRHLFEPPSRLNPALREELMALSNADQLEKLALGPHLRQDVGLDRGVEVSPTVWLPGR